jgi:hypothetical protein
MEDGHAAVFQDWAQMTLQPRFRPQVDVFTQNGRNGSARIEIDNYSGQAIYPFDDLARVPPHRAKHNSYLR